MTTYKEQGQDVVDLGYEGGGLRKGKAPTQKKQEKILAREGLIKQKETEAILEDSVEMAKRAGREREEAIQSMVRATPTLPQAEGARSTLAGITADPALRAQDKARADAMAAQVGEQGRAAQQAMVARLNEQAAKYAAEAKGAPYQPSAIGQQLAMTGAETALGYGADVARSQTPGLEGTVSTLADEEKVV
jgi:hypothetical protein